MWWSAQGPAEAVPVCSGGNTEVVGYSSLFLMLPCTSAPEVRFPRETKFRGRSIRARRTLSLRICISFLSTMNCNGYRGRKFESYFSLPQILNPGEAIGNQSPRFFSSSPCTAPSLASQDPEEPSKSPRDRKTHPLGGVPPAKRRKEKRGF